MSTNTIDYKRVTPMQAYKWAASGKLKTGLIGPNDKIRTYIPPYDPAMLLFATLCNKLGEAIIKRSPFLSCGYDEMPTDFYSRKPLKKADDIVSKNIELQTSEGQPFNLTKLTKGSKPKSDDWKNASIIWGPGLGIRWATGLMGTSIGKTPVLQRLLDKSATVYTIDQPWIDSNQNYPLSNINESEVLARRFYPSFADWALANNLDENPVIFMDHSMGVTNLEIHLSIYSDIIKKDPRLKKLFATRLSFGTPFPMVDGLMMLLSLGEPLLEKIGLDYFDYPGLGPLVKKLGIQKPLTNNPLNLGAFSCETLPSELIDEFFEHAVAPWSRNQLRFFRLGAYRGHFSYLNKPQPFWPGMLNVNFMGTRDPLGSFFGALAYQMPQPQSIRDKTSFINVDRSLPPSTNYILDNLDAINYIVIDPATHLELLCAGPSIFENFIWPTTEAIIDSIVNAKLLANNNVKRNQFYE